MCNFYLFAVCCVVCLHSFLFQLIFVFRLCMICRQSYDDIKHGEAEDLIEKFEIIVGMNGEGYEHLVKIVGVSIYEL